MATVTRGAPEGDARASEIDVPDLTTTANFWRDELLWAGCAGRATPDQVGLFYAAAIVLSLVSLLWASGRARELCVLSIRRGRVLVLRGALPQSLLEAVRDVVARQRVARGTVRVLRDGDRARLEGAGLDEPALQRLRNVLGTYPLARLLAAPLPRSQNLGQRLGLAWLSWWLHERR